MPLATSGLVKGAGENPGHQRGGCANGFTDSMNRPRHVGVPQLARNIDFIESFRVVLLNPPKRQMVV
ncbi:MAG: hypothetical protein RIC55_36285 [Pirellulaceae bacterium]